MMEILNGAMLGDGSLYKHEHCVNAQFTYTSKSYQHVEFVTKDFMDYSFKEKIKYTEYYDKRTDKIYSRYTFRSITSPTFTKEYNRWYENNIKHIPNDLVLTPLTCLIWYIGDGCLAGNSKNSTQEIQLSTNCFKKGELENIILPQLNEFKPKLNFCGYAKHTNEEQYGIRICTKESVVKFLNFIGPCPFDDYAYKWAIKERKTPSYNDVYDQWEQLYLSGVGYCDIAKQYGCDSSTVWWFLENRGIRKPFVGYKEFYEEWEQRYLNGETYLEISKDYDCHPQTILHHMNQFLKKGAIHDATA